jgi:beta-mannosidase
VTGASRFLELSEYFHPGVAVAGAWRAASTCANQATSSQGLRTLSLASVDAPATVAAVLRDRGELLRENPPDLDGQDYWLQGQFAADEWASNGTITSARQLLVFDGLATVASVWFNDVLVLETENMYRRYAVDVTDLVRERNELVLRFAALRPLLKARSGPRRWPTRLVTERNLRSFRTTLLGRMPGWTPPWPAVGPYRPIRLVSVLGSVLHQLSAVPSVDDRGPRVDISVALSTTKGEPPETVSFELAGESTPVPCSSDERGLYHGRATFRPSGVDLWWPHSHGGQPLYQARLRVRSNGFDETFEPAPLGFRKVELLPPEDFGFRINGVDVFCRGACWMPLDVVSLQPAPGLLRAALEQVRQAGMNMLRISGATLYEQPEFHRLCDELGILVWQDFMFANMDYPRGDTRFDTEVDVEAGQVLERLGAHCSTTLFCGSSETEQQAAMMGIAAAEWVHPLWRERLPQLVRGLCPSIPYWYSTPGGKGMPFWTRDGCTHYFGVGAYKRPLVDARVAGVRFASECLAFANPEEEIEPGSADPNQPLGRAPRDNGASWDFADVTQHYVDTLFGPHEENHPARGAAEAKQRWARHTTAHVFYEAQTHFRDPATECRGSLVWTLRDLEPGSGWGIVDCRGRPKAGYFALKRIWAPQAAWFVDEGLNGLAIVIMNDRGTPLDAHLRLGLFLGSGQPVEKHEQRVFVAPFGNLRVSAEELLGRFFDTTQSYHFGPSAFDYARVTLVSANGMISDQFWFAGSPSIDPGLELMVHEARGSNSTPGVVELVLESNRAARAVHLQIEGLVPRENYFDLAGGERRAVILEGDCGSAPLQCTVDALNLERPWRGTVPLTGTGANGD